MPLNPTSRLPQPPRPCVPRKAPSPTGTRRLCRRHEQRSRRIMIDEQKTAWAKLFQNRSRRLEPPQRRYVDRISAWRASILQKPHRNLLSLQRSRRHPSVPDGAIVLTEWPAAPTQGGRLRENWPAPPRLQTAASMDSSKGKCSATCPALPWVLPVLLFLVARAGNSFSGCDSRRSPAARCPIGRQRRPKPAADHSPRPAALRRCDTSRSICKTGVSTKSPGPQYLRTLPPGGTLVKSASYLMHKRYFSIRASSIHWRARAIEERPAPHLFFEPPKWDVRYSAPRHYRPQDRPGKI
jgi:hypothetical protein